MISAWVTYVTYASHTERVSSELEKEAIRIEHTLASEMEGANYMLNALGRQIVLDKHADLTNLAQMLKSFDSKDNLYSIFSWIGPQQQALVSSNRGILEKPVDLSDRDYVKKVLTDPWHMTIGRPIEGRVSNHWVIPVAMGITDYTGKFIGTLMISLDINVLTERLNKLIKRDGVSFAIVSKTLIPLAQVSEDKNFMTHHFPTEKLVNANFSSAPSGLISTGSLFWGTGTYAYYHVSQEYPYIILIGYDSKYSDETMRNMLWSRLMQMVVMALFFVLFLWIVRARMITPVMDMTAIAGNIASGKSYTPLPQGGPVEIESLSTQLQRVGEYIEETKRVEEELRHKMFSLKKSRERSEMSKRGLMEFIVYICQQIHPLMNNVVGFSQLMKDQLYGPIENRKYRQYASDIYLTSTALMEHLQDLQLYAKSGADYIELSEKSTDLGQVINKSLRLIADRMQVEKLAAKVTLQEPLPKLVADEFRLQQIMMNLLLYALERTLPQATMRIDAKVVSENKDKQFLALVVSSSDTLPGAPALVDIAEQLIFSPVYNTKLKPSDMYSDEPDLRLELAKSLVALHHGGIDVAYGKDSNVIITIVFAGGRLRFSE